MRDFLGQNEMEYLLRPIPTCHIRLATKKDHATPNKRSEGVARQ